MSPGEDGVQTFADFLRWTVGVPSSLIPEYALWAARFESWRAGPDGQSQAAGLAARREFLGAFVGTTPEWMLSRAERAIRIYVGYLKEQSVCAEARG